MDVRKHLSLFVCCMHCYTHTYHCHTSVDVISILVDESSVTPVFVFTVGARFISVTSYQASRDDELSFVRGAIVQVLKKYIDGWWLVRYASSPQCNHIITIYTLWSMECALAIGHDCMTTIPPPLAPTTCYH